MQTYTFKACWIEGARHSTRRCAKGAVVARDAAEAEAMVRAKLPQAEQVQLVALARGVQITSL